MHKAQYDAIQSQYQNKCNQLREAVIVIDQNKNEIEKLFNEKKDIMSKYNELSIAAQQYLLDHDLLKSQFEDEKNKLEAIRFNDEKNRRKIEELNSKIKKLEEEISDSRDTWTSSADMIITLSDKNKQLGKTVDEKQRLLNDIKRDFDGIVKQTQKYQQCFNEYDKFAIEARDLESKYNKLNASYNQICSQFTTAQNEILTYQYTIKQFEQKVNKNKNEIISLKGELEDAKRKNKDLENSNNQLNDQTKKLNKLIDYLRNIQYQGDTSSDDDDDEDSDSELYDKDYVEMDVDENDGGLWVLDGKNSIFQLNEIKNKKNPASSCRLYNCNGKNNTGFHYSTKSCPKYMQIRRTNGDFNAPDKIIFKKKSCIPNFKYWKPGQILVRLINLKFNSMCRLI